jgi:RimJ/RimL family protein N-acetyltransferase
VRVLEKCGLVRVGTEEAVLVHGGRAVDEYVYALAR